MRIEPAVHTVKGVTYTIRSARVQDAQALSELRVTIDGETENMDREPGEALLAAEAFERIIREDTEASRNLFLVAVTPQGPNQAERIVGYSRCEGSPLKRLAHKVEFGVGVLKEYWGFGIGSGLLGESIRWADAQGVRKMVLYVLETNEPAIRVYRKLGFEQEGILRMDKKLSDGRYYDTVVMGRVR